MAQFDLRTLHVRQTACALAFGDTRIVRLGQLLLGMLGGLGGLQQEGFAASILWPGSLVGCPSRGCRRSSSDNLRASATAPGLRRPSNTETKHCKGRDAADHEFHTLPFEKNVKVWWSSI